ncbi:MAG TPA: hypothetical protein VHM90_10375, partial [Phycisphaerae bacterium]|nr:hypothetical protein [Phycisphaerae bacterium]
MSPTLPFPMPSPRAHPSRTRPARSRAPRYFRALEALETRTLFAVSTLVINPGNHSATFSDVDGDVVTVSVSAGTLSPQNFIMFSLSATHDQLRTINLTDSSFTGASITFSINKSAGGDGLVNVGFINAGGIDLGAVTIPGDLGRINCGDGNGATAALTALNVRSIGRYGVSTQAPGGSLESDIANFVGSITVKTDITEAKLIVGGTISAAIGTLTIGGSLIGGSADRSGTVEVFGSIGALKITGDLLGGDGER